MLAAKLPRLETVEVVEEEMPTPGKGEGFCTLQK